MQPLAPRDLPYVGPLAGALAVEPVRGAKGALWLMVAAIAVALAWAALAQVDVIAKAGARIVPEGREQLVASLEGGILRELKVREGDAVSAGQELAVLDPTRMQAQRSEGAVRRAALKAAIARAGAEAAGTAPDFPRDTAAGLVRSEREVFAARQRLLTEAAETHQRNLELLQRELAMAEGLSGKGLLSEVEVMRLRRQVNELQQAAQERVSRHRQDASAELVRLRAELAQLDEQMVVRDDALARTVLRSPVAGIVKAVRNQTPGGVIAPGVPLVEIVPQDERLLVELRIKPSDIGFVRPGQPVLIKLSAYDYLVYGGLHGHVEMVGPDALGDAERGGAEATWFRALVRCDAGQLRSQGQPLALRPGMQGMAEIRTGERSVMSYLLRPMLRTQEAFRER